MRPGWVSASMRRAELVRSRKAGKATPFPAGNNQRHLLPLIVKII